MFHYSSSGHKLMINGLHCCSLQLKIFKLAHRETVTKIKGKGRKVKSSVNERNKAEYGALRKKMLYNF